MRRKILLILLLNILFFATLCSSTSAQSAMPIGTEIASANNERRPDPAYEFAKAIARKDLNLAQKYVEDFVQIPEIRESSGIHRCQLVSSPEEGVKIMVAHFKDEVLKGERLAFIWEITVKYDRITRIRVLFDGANPLVDEARLIREYQNRYRRDVLVPTEFPFKKVTQFNGYIEDDSSLVLVYRNDEMNGFFRVIASPITLELERYKGRDDVYCTLKDGTKALFRLKFELGYELRFQKNGMHYTLAIGNKKYLKVEFTPEVLIKTANSMI